MHAQTLSAGAVVDRYTVEGVLGEGGMAIVYRVRHSVLGTRHALKILTIGNTEIQRRLVQEGHLQASLQHPNIVAVTDVLQLGGAPALVMEFVDGPPLDQLLRQGRLTLTQADALARGILDGVAAAHTAGLVHRDLKPGNILLKVTDGGFVPKVADFGLAKMVGAAGSKTRTGSTMGTPQYMSPEQIRDSKNVGVTSDVFALGAILYELLTGARAFDGDDLLQIFTSVAAGQYLHPHAHVPDAPERMVSAILQALQVDPANRPQSVAELAARWADGTAAPASGTWSPEVLAMSRTAPSVSAPGTFTTSQPVTPAEVTLLPPPAVPSSLGSGAVVAAAGLGGLALTGIGGAALVLAVLGGGLWWWTARPEAAATPPAVSQVVDVAPDPAGSTPEPEPTATPEPVAVDGATPAAVSSPATPTPGGPRPVASDEVPPADVVADVAPPEPDPLPEDVAGTVEAAPEPHPAPAAAPGVPEWTQFLASDDPAERRRGVTNLRNRTDEESLLLLVRVLREEPLADIRADAAKALAWRADEARGDYEQLMSGLATCTARTESEALPCVQALGRRGERPDQLSRALSHKSAKVRAAAVDAARALAPRAPDGFDWGAVLGPLTSDPDAVVAKKATQAKAAMGF
jgi:hypothetical protein